MTARYLRLVALAAACLLVAAACGQKPGVAEQPGAVAAGGELQLPEGTALDAEGNLIDTETGEIIATAEELAEQNTSLGSDTGTTGTGETSGDTAGDGGTGAAPSGEGDSTGVTADTIKIGIHAPITGAAPVPSQSFQKGKDLYWDWLKQNKQSILGRDVEVTFRNDNYNPSQAVSVCREMVEEDKVFLLVGIAGTDQIQACARYAASVGVPYVSAGVTEIGLSDLRNYFAIWLTYKQQGPLLADMMVTKLGARDETNGMLRFRTPTFEDAHSGFLEGMKKHGAPVQYDRTVSKTAGQTDAQAIATEICQQENVDNLYVLTSPTFFIQLAQSAANQRCFPQYVGVGLSMTIDTVASVACRNQSSIDKARFLSPFPAYANSDQYDPDFRKAGGTDDIMFGLWGASKVVAEMLKTGGNSLTRQSFILGSERLRNVKTGVLPNFSFSEGDHLGGTAMHLNRAECSQNRWVTEQAFVSDF